MTKLRIALLVANLALAACVASEVRRDLVPHPGSGKGIVIVSVSNVEGYIAYPPVCEYRSMHGNLKGNTPMMVGLSAHSDPAIFYSKATRNSLDKPAMLGRISAFELPTGEYEFFACASVGGARGHVASSRFSMPFQVADGEVRYLGRIEVTPVTPEGFFGIEIMDAHAADFELVRTLWPGIDTTRLKAALLKLPAR